MRTHLLTANDAKDLANIHKNYRYITGNVTNLLDNVEVMAIHGYDKLEFKILLNNDEIAYLENLGYKIKNTKLKYVNERYIINDIIEPVTIIEIGVISWE